MARGHIRERGSGWEVRAYVGRDTAGKERYLTRTVHGTKRDAQRALTALLGEIDSGRAPSGGRHTFAEAADRWLTANRARMSPGSVMTSEDNLRRCLLPALGSTPVERIRTEDLDELFARLLGSGARNGAPLSSATVVRAAGVAHAVLEAARRWRWIARNPADDRLPIANRRREPTTPEHPVVRQLVATANEADPEFGLFIRLCAILGGRRGEACGLRWPSVDLDAGVVRIERRLVAGRDAGGHEVVKELEGTKNGRRRKEAIDPHTVALLRAQRTRQRERALACGVPLRADGFVFSYAPDASEGWKPHSVSQRFRRLRNRQGPAFSGIRLHDLRHYVASHLLDNHVPIEVVSARIGHQSTRTTSDIYGTPVTTSDRRAADLLAEALDGGRTHG